MDTSDEDVTILSSRRGLTDITMITSESEFLTFDDISEDKFHHDEIILIYKNENFIEYESYFFFSTEEDLCNLIQPPGEPDTPDYVIRLILYSEDVEDYVNVCEKENFFTRIWKVLREWFCCSKSEIRE